METNLEDGGAVPIYGLGGPSLFVASGRQNIAARALLFMIIKQ